MKRLLLVIMALISQSVFAAKPVSITYVKSVEQDGASFDLYSVRCSNGEKKSITAWDKRKKWCAGDGAIIDCSKKQIKTAKKICR